MEWGQPYSAQTLALRPLTRVRGQIPVIGSRASLRAQVRGLVVYTIEPHDRLTSGGQVAWFSSIAYLAQYWLVHTLPPDRRMGPTTARPQNTVRTWDLAIFAKAPELN